MTGRGETEREGQNITALLYFYFLKLGGKYEQGLQNRME